MLTHLYLPLQKEGKSPQIPEATGKWDANDKRILMAVAEGIVVDEQAVTRGVSSVPDAWARPLMFASALHPLSGHPLRDRLVEEWRGLLSLLALAQVHRHEIELVRVPLQPGVFTNALTQLAPAPVRLEEQTRYTWTDVFIVKYEGIPVGGLSPRTLVYTGTDYASRLKATTLSLKNLDGFLTPPRDREEQLAVAEWVVQLQRRLSPVLYADERNPDQATVGLINRLLKDWEGTLRQQLGLTSRDDVDSAEVEVDDDALMVRGGESIRTSHRVYFELLRPLTSTGSAQRVSTELALQHRRNLSTPRRSAVVVISRNLIGNNARIWETKRLNNLGGDVEQALTRYFDAASGTLIDREDLAKQDGIWIRPERYFLTDVLLKARSGSRFVADTEARLNGDTRFVLPFTREILDFFSPEDVQRLEPEFTRESEQSITFRFKLPVGSTTERVEKTYRYKNPERGEGTLAEVDAPVLEIFPRYLDPSWRRYFLFQQDATKVVATPVVTAANATRTRREHTDAQGRKVLITVTTGDTVQDDSGTRLPFPEAIDLSTPAGVPAGVVLLAAPAQPRARSGEWRIGIDFGTSNTNVFRQSSRAAEAERCKFRFTEHVQPLTASTTTTRSEYLLPRGDIDLPIATHLRIHQEPLREHTLLDYFMDLSSEYRVPDNVYTNIKWQDKDRKTEFFLEGLLLMILIDAVKARVDTVKFACSYPKAFSQNAVSIFKGEWEKVMRKTLEGPGRLLDTHKRSDDGHLQRATDAFEVEGVAAGEFFTSEKTITNISDRANKANAALCLDVGGGTTDISIWFDDAIIADASVRLAGRQIGEMLRTHFEILELLLSPPAIRALEEQRGLPDPFAARLNVALRKEDHHIQEMLIRHSNAREIQALKRLLVCEFGAIAFYAAQMIAAADRGVAGGALLPRIATSGIGFHWGGNAAKFINWIDLGRFDQSGIGPMILNAIVYNALQDAGVKVSGRSIAQHQSPGHKSEAAAGLAVMELGRSQLGGHGDMDFDMGAAREAGIVCGENIELTSGPVTYLDEISEGTLFHGQKTTFVKTSLDRLRRFVEVVNHFGVHRGVFTNDSKITLDDRWRVQIADLVRAEFVKAQSVREGHRDIEPVFIMEVKVLLELLRGDLGR